MKLCCIVPTVVLSSVKYNATPENITPIKTVIIVMLNHNLSSASFLCMKKECYFVKVSGNVCAVFNSPLNSHQTTLSTTILPDRVQKGATM